MNTSNFNAYLLHSIARHLRSVGAARACRSKDELASMARNYGFVTCKEDLLLQLSFGTALREMALVAPFPLFKHITQLYCSGEQ